jgi:hypothetical protein
MKIFWRCGLLISGAAISCGPLHAEDRTRHKALCSAYSPFTPCEVFIYEDARITSNIPRGYLDVSRKNIRSIEVCDADVRCKPLLGENLKYVWKDSAISPFTAVVDFRVKYYDDFTQRKTVIFRYYNRFAAEEFGARLLKVSSGQSIK